MKILIADVLTLTKGNIVYGHYSKTAEQYKSILQNSFQVKIAGGKTYGKYFDTDDILKLPFITTKKEFDSNNLLIRILRTFKIIINILVILMSDADTVIFQDCVQTILYTILRIIPTKKKIILIKYAVDSRERSNHSFDKIKDRIFGIITSIEEVATFYDVNYLIVPDYFPDDSPKGSCITEYDFGIIGTITLEKDYQMIIDNVNNSNYTAIIAGYFSDKSLLQELREIAQDNVKIIDKYLSEEEYKRLINKCRFIVLPYKTGYKLKSSGVVLDAIYNYKPVITPKFTSFKFVSDNNLGYQYAYKISEVFEKIKTQPNELFFEDFINQCTKKKKELIEFVRK